MVGSGCDVSIPASPPISMVGARIHGSFCQYHLGGAWKDGPMRDAELKILVLVGGLVAIFYFPIYWVASHPNWRSHIFQDGVALAHQPVVECLAQEVSICWWGKWSPYIIINSGWWESSNWMLFHACVANFSDPHAYGSYDPVPVGKGQVPRWKFRPVSDGCGNPPGFFSLITGWGPLRCHVWLPGG